MSVGEWIARCTGVFLVVAIPCSASAQGSASKSLAALISDLSGEVSVTQKPGGALTKAQRFDAIPLGATVETGPSARAEIVLAGGQRFELGAKARGTIAEKHLTSTSGPVKELPSLPPLPRMAALDESRPKGPAGGVRLRGGTVSGLQPSHIVTLAEGTRLRFLPVAGASRYAVEIQDDAGRRIFSVESTVSEVVVPAGVLAAGGAYYWTVQTLDKVGGAARGATEFRTLSAEDARIREAVLRTLEGDGNGGLALRAEIDRRLGLYEEALNGFRAALARTPEDRSIQEALRRLAQMPESPE
jgi:hypothetical protein